MREHRGTIDIGYIADTDLAEGVAVIPGAAVNSVKLAERSAGDKTTQGVIYAESCLPGLLNALIAGKWIYGREQRRRFHIKIAVIWRGYLLNVLAKQLFRILFIRRHYLPPA